MAPLAPVPPSSGSIHSARPIFWRSHYALGYLVLGALATYLYFSEHRAHFLGVLPFLLLLACPLMHLFMHRGHGGHGSRASTSPNNDPGSRK